MTGLGLMFGRLPLKARGGCPYAGGTVVGFGRADVAAVGKLTTHGAQGITRIVVRLRDGRELFVLVYQQAPDRRRWLRRLADVVPAPRAPRDPGFAFSWTETNNERKAA